MTIWMRLPRLVLSGTIALLALRTSVVQAPANRWDRPSRDLGAQISAILGPGQANLTIRNVSSIPTDEIPAIRAQLEQNLKAHGVQTSGAESANTIRVTLSENQRERLWVAEILQGNETRVTMVQVEAGAPHAAEQAKGGLILRKQPVIETKQPVLATLETKDALIAAEPNEIVIYANTPAGWQPEQTSTIDTKRVLTRDPKAVIVPIESEDGFDAWLAGIQCSGRATQPHVTTSDSVTCRESDDPWPIAPLSGAMTEEAPVPDLEIGTERAFFNSSRNYFTGVVTPTLGVDLPPFYSMASVPWSPGLGMTLIGGIDGKVLGQAVANQPLKTVTGTRDWGSDFAMLHSGCGEGYQVIASGSGEALSDSLRGYEFPNQDAVPVSQPLAMDGSVTALWTAPDGKSVYASVRKQSGDYEVDRVTALCN
jgi:hypothetical protein